MAFDRRRVLFLLFSLCFFGILIVPVSGKDRCYGLDIGFSPRFGLSVPTVKAKEPRPDGSFDFSTEIGGEDSLEGMNRTLFEINDFFVWWLLRPIGTVYCTILPNPAIKAIGRCSDNIEFPRRALSAILQGKFRSSGIASLRFLVNTTFSAGLFDPAYHWFGLEKQEEDFGQAFASWGFGSGAYVFLPVDGPSNVRDAIGKIFDYAADPKTYIPVPGIQSFAKMNQGISWFSAYSAVRNSTADPYKLLRDLGNARRQLQLRDFDRRSTIEQERRKEHSERMLNAFERQDMEEKRALDALDQLAKQKLYRELNAIDPAGDVPQGNRIDTLKVEMFDVQNSGEEVWSYLSMFNDEFINQGEVREIALIKDRDEMAYKFWAQDDHPEAPLAVIIPGLGGHYTGSIPTAMAELLHRNGYAVAILNSSMCFEFMRSASSSTYPGFTPYDVQDVRKAVAAVVRDLEQNRECKFKRKVMLGFSLGALHTLWIAALEHKQPLLGFDRYLAINPPVDMLYSLQRLDKYFNRWRQWERKELLYHAFRAAGSYMGMANRKYQHQGYRKKSGKEPAVKFKPPSEKNEGAPKVENPETNRQYMTDISDEEAELLIGYSFRRTLEEVLVTAHKREDLGILKTPYSWGNRAELYREIAQISYYDYATKFLLKYVSRREKKPVSVEQLARRSGIYAIGEIIKDDPKVRIIHSADDIIVSDEQRRYLKNLFGEKAIFFTHGGHLGNLYLKDVHDCILSELDPVESTEDIIRRTLSDPSQEDKNPSGMVDVKKP